MRLIIKGVWQGLLLGNSVTYNSVLSLTNGFRDMKWNRPITC